MATTTPNFGWSVPTSTDLVKDGATAIETLGDSIDASLVDLKGGTTGQVLAKASNTDMDFTWASDATGIPASAFTAKGVLLVGTGTSTYQSQTVGANGTVLTADSAEADGVKWATPSSPTDTWTLLNTGGTALTGASTITISGITSSKLFIQLVAASSANANAYIGLRFNSDSGNNYNSSLSSYDYSNTFDKSSWYNDTDTFNFLLMGRIGDSASNTLGGFVTVDNCTSTSRKVWRSIGGAASGSGVNARVTSGQGFYLGTSAITSVSAYSSTGNFDNGTIFVYGA
jgi:hypothetical protein